MARRILMTIATALVLSVLALAAVDKPNFTGTWNLDRARSYGLPGNMTQIMTVTQKEDQIEVETKLIQPGNERVQKDTYILDGKEHEFQPPTPPAPPGQPAPPAPPKGKRTATWLPAGNGITVTDVMTNQTPNGPVPVQIVRKWTLSGQELVIDMYVDNPNISYEAKRIFKRS